MTAIAHTEDVGVLQVVFREVMASVCTPVSVVTAMSGDLPHGTTVSAFSSLSMDPPMVLIALDQKSELLILIRQTRRFGLNVLGSTQHDLATTFASKGGVAKFAGVSWDLRAGVPRIPGVAGFLACEVCDFIPGGDHHVVFGKVVLAEPDEAPPLTYQRRVFGTHVAFGGVSS